MTEDYIDVSIIGGGIGGLAAALALQLVNPHLKVKVFERDNQMSDRRQGYGLTLTNNKSGPLAKLGLLEDCINCNSTCPSNSHYTFDSNGNVIGYYGRAIKSKYFSQQSAPRLPEFGGNEGNLRIPRQELRSLLLQRLQPDTVVWGKKLIKFYENENEVEVHFDRDSNCNSTPVAADIIKTKILVGADGIKSVVRNLMDEQTSKTKGSEEKNTPVASSLKYIGISVIIGLSSSRKPHPLTHNRGFYVVDGTHRLFTMPFVRRKAKTTNPLSPIPAHSGEENEDETDVEDYLTMWQLSFSGLDEEQAAALKNCDTAELLRTALHRTASWFSAVRELLHQTIPNEIWATGLFDRDPMKVKAGSAGKRRWSRVTCLGDACHPMSQGANQALEDGPLLARWLGPEPPGMKRRRAGKQGAKCADLEGVEPSQQGAEGATQEEKYFDTLDSSAICNRLRCFEREAVARSSSKVLSSRKAAQYLHCPQVLADALQHPVIEGLGDAWHGRPQEGEQPALCQLMRAAGVHADLGALLDDALVRAVEPLIPACSATD